MNKTEENTKNHEIGDIFSPNVLGCVYNKITRHIESSKGWHPNFCLVTKPMKITKDLNHCWEINDGEFFASKEYLEQYNNQNEIYK